MGIMQSKFEDLLGGVGIVEHKKLAFPRLHDVARAGYEDLVYSVYKSLGGVLLSAELNLRSWDLEFEGIAVELDEHLHFNRYRALTLGATAYANLPAFPMDAYRRYCAEFEDDCLRAGAYGRKWSSASCERQFGVGSAQKILEGAGAPRWKQRAFYDFVKDLSPLVLGVKLARIAIWDSIIDGGTRRTVRDLLSEPTITSAEALANLVRARAA